MTDGSRSAAQTSEARAGELDFETVYEAHFDFVYRVVARLGGHDVEDLVQEVFMVVHRRLGEFRGDARITTWLFRIAYRVVGAHLRKRRLQRAIAAWLGLERDARGDAAQAAGAESLEEARRMRAALEALSYEKRSALVLFEVEGWSAGEVAEMLGIPVGTVYTRLHHARSALRSAYERSSKVEAP